MQNSVNKANASPSPSPGSGFNVDAPAFSYDVVFPALSTPNAAPQPQKAWAASRNPRIGSTMITQHFVISRDERKFDNIDKFGERDNPCLQIMQATKTTIEIFAGKDQNLAFLVCGKPADVYEARKRIIASFQTPHQATIDVPKEYYGVILGKKGAKLQNLESTNNCKIRMPDKDSNSDTIVISGPRSGVEKALYHIKVIYDEESRQAVERVQVPKIYHPFICGGHNENITRLQEENDVLINVPPATVQRDEIVISGAREGVAVATKAIMAIFEEMKGKCKQVSVEVPRSQHKHIMGLRGLNLSEILKQTGVAVEIPVDETTDTITLRGPQEKLGSALTMVCEKASSIKTVTINAPSWLHKRLRGKKSANIRRISNDDPSIYFEFKEDTDSIKIEGPADQVTRVQEELEKETAEFLNTLVQDELIMDSKYAKHIIGKGGVNVNRLKEETGVEINITEENDIVTAQIGGTPEGVAKVRTEMLDLINKITTKKEVSVNVDCKLIRLLKQDRVIREMFPRVLIGFPLLGKPGDVKLRGPVEDIDQCVAHLQAVSRELAETNFLLEIPVKKEFHRVIIGRNGANIKKIREDTGCTIVLPSEFDQSDLIAIIGNEAEVHIAKERIQKIQEEMTSTASQELPVSSKFYHVAMRTRPRILQTINEDCNVQIKFLDTDSKNIRLVARGAKEDVERAIPLLRAKMRDVEEAGYTARIKIDPKYHKLIVGRRGWTISKIQDSTHTMILLPNENDEDKETVEIMGKKEEVELAQKELVQLIDSIENTIEIDVSVDPKHHRLFTSRHRHLLNEIQDEFGGVTILFPKSKEDKVKIKGVKTVVELAKQRIEEIDAEIVTLNIDIPNVFHRSLKRNEEVQRLENDQGVIISFPKPAIRSNEYADAEPVNGIVEDPNVVTITGRPKNCENAREALLVYLPITVQEPVPNDIHRSIIGKGGEGIRELMKSCPDVRFNMPKAEDKLDYIELVGVAADVEEARKILRERISNIEKDKEDRILRSHTISFELDPEFYKTIIGPRGKTMNQIREEFGVSVNLPRRDVPEDGNTITITGYEKNAFAARDKILLIADEQSRQAKDEIEIDSRLHSRLIGTKRQKIRRLEMDYNVHVKFARSKDPNPNLVTIFGPDDDAISDAREELLAMAERISTSMDDWLARPAPVAKWPDEGAAKEGFVVTGAPWQQTPNTDSIKDFPSFGLPDESSNAPPVATWGPRR